MAQPRIYVAALDHIEDDDLTRRGADEDARDRLEFDEADKQALLAEQLLARGTKGIAKERGVSVRTLQRRLAAQGLRARQVVAELGRERAKQLLRSGLRVGDVAFELGFSGTEAFSRFCRRELGATPTELRRRRGVQLPPRPARTGLAGRASCQTAGGLDKIPPQPKRSPRI